MQNVPESLLGKLLRLDCRFLHIKRGGVTNYVIDGENGYALSNTSTEKDFFEKIKFCVETGVLEELSHKSVLLYKNKLNWNHWGNEVRNLFNSILNKS